MKIQFLGAAGSVTGSCYLVTTGNTRFVVDCGMFQGSRSLKERNWGDFPFRPAEIAFALLTHAHIDHSGLLPKLRKHGFYGPIFSTPATGALCSYLLPDSGHIQVTECEQKNRRLQRRGDQHITPIYTEDDAILTARQFQPVPLHEERQVHPAVKVRFSNAGHILGAAFIEVWVTEAGETRKIIFSGDIGAPEHPIIQDPEHAEETDFLLIESTYGDRTRDDEPNEVRRKRLGEVVNEVCNRGGNLIIPGFAVGRTQDILHDLQILVRERTIPTVPVWVDSPLATHVTKVFADFPEEYDDDARRLLSGRKNLFEAPWIRFTRSLQESQALNDAQGSIILSASGMCDAGRIKHHLRHHLYKPADAVLVVGYQAEGTLGRLLLEGERRVRIHGYEVAVRASIHQIPGYSGHADQDDLMGWLSHITHVRRAVFVVHGEDAARETLAARIRKERGFDVRIPGYREEVDLLTAEVTAAPTVAQPAVDSHNAYAQLMLELATFMQREADEQKRAARLASLRALLA